MKVLRSILELNHIPGPIVLAIGVFDGLHLGHRAVLERTLEEARSVGGTAVPLSFDPHPVRVLRPESAPTLLSASPHKLHLLRAMGFSHTLLLPFDHTLASTSADAFIQNLSDAARPLAAICVGRDWSFGKGREGNLQKLAMLGAQLNFREIGVSEIHMDGEIVSSTRIRSAVALGDLSGAERLLGRPYSVFGEVQHGRALGRTLGYPTANLALLNEQLPPLGVYAVRVYGAAFSGAREGVANLGIRPTVDSTVTHPSLEVHLFDVSQDLYGQTLEVEFAAFLREELKFSSLEFLRQQIQRDEKQARAFFNHPPTPAQHTS